MGSTIAVLMLVPLLSCAAAYSTECLATTAATQPQLGGSIITAASVIDAVAYFAVNATRIERLEIGDVLNATSGAPPIADQHVAGSVTPGTADGIGAAARFTNIVALAGSRSGATPVLYAVDNAAVRRITVNPASRASVVSTIYSGGALDASAAYISVDSHRQTLLISQPVRHCVQALALSSGALQTVAGTCGISATLNSPTAVYALATGKVFVATASFLYEVRGGGELSAVAITQNTPPIRVIAAPAAAATKGDLVLSGGVCGLRFPTDSGLSSPVVKSCSWVPFAVVPLGLSRYVVVQQSAMKPIVLLTQCGPSGVTTPAGSSSPVAPSTAGGSTVAPPPATTSAAPSPTTVSGTANGGTTAVPAPAGDETSSAVVLLAFTVLGIICLVLIIVVTIVAIRAFSKAGRGESYRVGEEESEPTEEQRSNARDGDEANNVEMAQVSRVSSMSIKNTFKGANSAASLGISEMSKSEQVNTNLDTTRAAVLQVMANPAMAAPGNRLPALPLAPPSHASADHGNVNLSPESARDSGGDHGGTSLKHPPTPPALSISRIENASLSAPPREQTPLSASQLRAAATVHEHSTSLVSVHIAHPNHSNADSGGSGSISTVCTQLSVQKSGKQRRRRSSANDSTRSALVVARMEIASGAATPQEHALVDRHNSRCESVAAGLYQKGKLLGRGTSGVVYTAVLNDGSTVAVKVMNMVGTPESAKAMAADVEREVRMLSQLRHPSVIMYYGAVFDSDNMQVRLFMELVQGGSLAAMVKSLNARMREVLVRKFMRQIVEGLAFMHDRGFLHRDLKADNVLIDTSDGSVKLTDFGTAKAVGNASQTCRAAQTMIGTPLFMAPEVIAPAVSEEEMPQDEIGYGKKADIWSLGIMCAEILDRGRMPWPNFASPGHAFMYINSEKGIPTPPEGISAEAAAFVLRCCVRDPKARPTASVLLDDEFLVLHPDSGAPLTPQHRSAAVKDATIFRQATDDMMLSDGDDEGSPTVASPTAGSPTAASPSVGSPMTSS
jgi:serine/threonine protein kinase